MKEVNLAYYEKNDWEKLLELSVDSETMHDTWQEWNRSFLKAKNDFSSLGFTVHTQKVNIKELQIYCAENNLKIDGKARAEFVSR